MFMKSSLILLILLIATQIYSLDVTLIMTTRFRKIVQSKLGVSEPDPSWFGNKANEPRNPNWSNKNWLKSRFHFSFAEYSNPRNTGFGILRVLNDDLVQPLRGFGEHPHRDAEICTYVVSGELTHKDSMKTEETLRRGAIQFMTAGSGVTHSEHNLHATDPLRFIQIWMNPRKRGLKPNYGSGTSTPEDRANKWFHLVSDTESSVATSIKINQDVNIHVTEISEGITTEFALAQGRQAYLLCIEGSADIKYNEEDGTEHTTFLDQHDAAEVFGSTTLVVTPKDTQKVHLLLLEMAHTGIGRTDL